MLARDSARATSVQAYTILTHGTFTLAIMHAGTRQREGHLRASIHNWMKTQSTADEYVSSRYSKNGSFIFFVIANTIINEYGFPVVSADGKLVFGQRTC